MYGIIPNNDSAMHPKSISNGDWSYATIQLPSEKSHPELVIFRLPPKKLPAILSTRPQPSQNRQAMADPAIIPNRHSVDSLITSLQATRREIAETDKSYMEAMQERDEELTQLRRAISFQIQRGDRAESVAIDVLGSKKELKERVTHLEQEVRDLKDQNRKYEAELQQLQADQAAKTKAEEELESTKRKCSELESTFAALKGVMSSHTERAPDIKDDDEDEDDIKPPRRRRRIF